MDKNFGLGPAKLLIPILLALSAPGPRVPLAAAVTVSGGSAGWTRRLLPALRAIDSTYGGRVGVYVKSLASGQEAGLRADQSWYLASGVKVPIAIEVLSKIDRGEIELGTRVRLAASDYVDGAGTTNARAVGSLLTVRELLGQMLQESDNTASDLLIGMVGLERVNALVRTIDRRGFGWITTLADVRRRVYSGLHPSADRLSGEDFLKLKALKGDPARIRALLRMLGLRPADLRAPTLSRSYEAYYALGLNSGTLAAYGRLLELLAEGELLSSRSTATLLGIMLKARTGRDRLKAGLGRRRMLAHKTGTQRGRVCDLGIAWGESARIAEGVVIAACAKGFRSAKGAGRALRRVGQAIDSSGVFSAS